VGGVSNGAEGLGLFLPKNFTVAAPGVQEGDGLITETDSQLSTWYRGKRYGFSQ
jgi:hypothetical protein